MFYLFHFCLIFLLFPINFFPGLLIRFQCEVSNHICQKYNNHDVIKVPQSMSCIPWINIEREKAVSTDQKFALSLRMLNAITFLHPNDLTQVLSGFRQNNFHRQLSFSIQLWNMFHRTDNELHHTSSILEGWCRAFRGHISSCYPMSWRFIMVLRKEERLIRVGTIQNISWHLPQSQQKYS